MSGRIEVSAEDDEAVRDAVWRFCAAWNMHNPKYMAAGWVEDGDLINPYGHLAPGRDAVEALFAFEQKTVFAKSKYSAPAIRRILHVGSKDVVVVTYDGIITGMRAPDGTPWQPLVHIGTTVLVRVDGKFLVASARPSAIEPLPPWAETWQEHIGNTPATPPKAQL
jgi:uncharacterized protein (TIGR02246 family)